MKNKMIKMTMLEYGMRQWELARLLGVSESVMSRKMRDELPEEEQERIIKLIEEARA